MLARRQVEVTPERKDLLSRKRAGDSPRRLRAFSPAHFSVDHRRIETTSSRLINKTTSSINPARRFNKLEHFKWRMPADQSALTLRCISS